jgi:hypothetical protein
LVPMQEDYGNDVHWPRNRGWEAGTKAR